jgi:hypothetical protein
MHAVEHPPRLATATPRQPYSHTWKRECPGQGPRHPQWTRRYSIRTAPRSWSMARRSLYDPWPRGSPDSSVLHAIAGGPRRDRALPRLCERSPVDATTNPELCAAGSPGLPPAVRAGRPAHPRERPRHGRRPGIGHGASVHRVRAVSSHTTRRGRVHRAGRVHARAACTGAGVRRGAALVAGGSKEDPARPRERSLRGSRVYVSSGSPSACRSAARLLAEMRVSGWLTPSTRRRRARVSSSSARAC